VDDPAQVSEETLHPIRRGLAGKAAAAKRETAETGETTAEETAVADETEKAADPDDSA
jgi:hypothetical protein